MKPTISFLSLLLATGLFFSCQQTPEGQKVEAGDAQEVSATPVGATFNVDKEASAINWVATKVTGQHNGTISVSNGQLNVLNGEILGGNFTLDIKSITVLDLTGEDKGKLEGHLRSGDFFDGDQYPTGMFEITAVEPVSGSADITHNISGNLTLKGVSKSVTIPANVVIAENMVSAITPVFKINRTEWGINYGSGVIGTAKDKIIHDEISLAINLKANI
jgi:polyisoprenoid-binding protein YceI